MDLILGSLLGLGLAAAAGLRVFVPLLIAGLAARLGHIELAQGFAWLGATPVLVALGVATLLEALAYQIPWLDNALDALATPLAALAGTLLMASTLLEVDPFWRWTLALIAGGGVASAVQGGTTGLRLASTAGTGGLANPLLAAGETGGAVTLGLVAVLLPVLAGLLVLAALGLGLRRLFRRRRGIAG
ncbi:MAG: DUF4126 domain-containing protein [Candidatus Krumholzibacteriia bacterium]